MPMPVERQVVSIFAGTRGFLDEFPVARVRPFEDEMLRYVEERAPEIFREILEKKALAAELQQKLQDVLAEFAAEFRKTPNA